MFTREPVPTALAALTAALLLGGGVVLSRSLRRAGLPVALLFLGIGMLAGSEGIGVRVGGFELAFRTGTVALALILFEGGLSTSRRVLRQSLAPAALLATAGVLATAALVALAARVLGQDWPLAMLLGVVVSSTDAAAVFSLLRGSGVQLQERVGGVLELESGLNDPMAVVLTLALTRALVEPTALGHLGLTASLLGLFQLVVGALLGALVGYGGRWLLRVARPEAGGLYPVLTFSLAGLAFGGPTLLHGSGFLAVYVAGVVLGAGQLPYRAALQRIHDFVAWLAQVCMFLVFGLLVVPSELPAVAPRGLALAGWLALVARPLAALVCLLPFRFRAREVIYVGWVGLRGAVPITLAIFPVLAGAPGASELFRVVFFVVLVSTLVQGSSLRPLTRWLGLEAAGPPPPPAALEITSTQILKGEILTFYVDRASAVCGASISELPFPEEAVVMLILRDGQLLAPKGPTRFAPGDHVYVFCPPEQLELMRLLFAQVEA